jgi:hypothetical protein
VTCIPILKCTRLHGIRVHVWRLCMGAVCVHTAVELGVL